MYSTRLFSRSAWLLALAVSAVSAASGAFGAMQEDAPAADLPIKASATESTLVAGWGQSLPSAQLDTQRGGFDTVLNDMELSSSVANNSATNVQSGNNYITQGAFSNASGFPMVIQNSGSNVSIQNATIVNLQMN